METNLKSAAIHTHNAIQKISDLIDSRDGSGLDPQTQSVIDDIKTIMIEYQPLLGAYLIRDHFESN